MAPSWNMKKGDEDTVSKQEDASYSINVFPCSIPSEQTCIGLCPQCFLLSEELMTSLL